MATLALSAGGALLGGAVGGSVGASVGWALGGLAGAMLFPQGGKDTTGPRLSDLSVQSAAYRHRQPDPWPPEPLDHRTVLQSGPLHRGGARLAGDLG